MILITHIEGLRENLDQVLHVSYDERTGSSVVREESFAGTDDPIPTDAAAMRRRIRKSYKTVDLRSALHIAWDLGVVVLPLHDRGTFHGACWRYEGRNAVVLKQTSGHEARWLFDVGPGQIDVVVHPQSVVHSLVELVDGSMIAQLGVTDMRLPIQYAFSYPERWEASVPRLDLARAGRLDFEQPDTGRFPCLALAFRALGGDPGLPIVLNAANEVAVAAFLEEKIPFPAIGDLIRRGMDAYETAGARPVGNLGDVRAIDGWAREYTERETRKVKSNV